MNELFKDCHFCTHLDFAINHHKSINLKYQPWSSSHIFFHHVLKRKGSPDQPQVPTPWTVQLWTSRMCHHWSGLWHRETIPMVKTSPSTKYGDLIPMTDPYVCMVYYIYIYVDWCQHDWGFCWWQMANIRHGIWKIHEFSPWRFMETLPISPSCNWGCGMIWNETGTHGPFFF